MTAELGHLALALAMLSGLCLAVFPSLGVWRRDTRLMAMASPVAYWQLLLVLIAFVCLIENFISHDFSNQLVANHSNRDLPFWYRVAASWGSHEGSMLLWILMLALWTAALAAFSGKLPQSMRARVLAVLGAVSIGFYLFALLTSNPFERVVPAPINGRDLNPLLQDPGMVFHPPLLYMGYVGFAVAFAFAIAGLIEGRFDSAWARWVRPWTNIAWGFLSLGICLGSFWAYYELGWGGWWFWDPVENASFMPWLTGTALIHSLAVTEKRGNFRSWTVLLAIMSFSLSLLGTFLVRSGVLTSVHAFATDPTRGVFILIFLCIVIGGSLSLYALRAHTVHSSQAYGLLSRESMLLANNIVMVVAMFAVLLGTLYPLALDSLDLGKISVGPPYFDAVFVPLMLPALFLMAIGPLSRWRDTPMLPLIDRMRWAFAASLLIALLLPFTASEDYKPMTALGLWLALWIAAAVLLNAAENMKSPSSRMDASRLLLQPGSWWGMQLAHLGVASFVMGVSLVNSYEIEIEKKLAPGDVLKIDKDLSLRYAETLQRRGPNYEAIQVRFELLEGQRVVGELRPEKRRYNSSKMVMTEAGIRRSLLGDLYIALGEAHGDGWLTRVQRKPAVNWIWIGVLMMGLGGFWAAGDA
ncbi:MAG: heme lyase CcmF/NrfE family subunit, partial [Betaproteobacteria bacterium]|nr:heme lyase CcmF/NrfE family subunit [Betaproteobacteria bacterium]